MINGADRVFEQRGRLALAGRLEQVLGLQRRKQWANQHSRGECGEEQALHGIVSCARELPGTTQLSIRLAAQPVLSSRTAIQLHVSDAR